MGAGARGRRGNRLRSLTRNEHGVAVPKQFCSLQGGPCLLQEALQRAASVAPLQRICSVVAEQHRQWWTPLLSYLPEQNVISQPQNKGTAFGILLPLLRIMERDPDATVVLLPADHYLSDEKIMARSAAPCRSVCACRSRLDISFRRASRTSPTPSWAISCRDSTQRGGAAGVLRFIEKPNAIRARVLLDDGALWNVFIMAASVRTLLSLFDSRFAATIAAHARLRGRAIWIRSTRICTPWIFPGMCCKAGNPCSRC